MKKAGEEHTVAPAEDTRMRVGALRRQDQALYCVGHSIVSFK